jgi:hypothetical protein
MWHGLNSAVPYTKFLKFQGARALTILNLMLEISESTLFCTSRLVPRTFTFFFQTLFPVWTSLLFLQFLTFHLHWIFHMHYPTSKVQLDVTTLLYFHKYPSGLTSSSLSQNRQQLPPLASRIFLFNKNSVYH